MEEFSDFSGISASSQVSSLWNDVRLEAPFPALQHTTVCHETGSTSGSRRFRYVLKTRKIKPVRMVDQGEISYKYLLT